jgi:hypothetical protein
VRSMGLPRTCSRSEARHQSAQQLADRRVHALREVENSIASMGITIAEPSLGPSHDFRAAKAPHSSCDRVRLATGERKPN